MDWKEGEGHGRGGTNFVMTLMIIIIIIIIIIITTTTTKIINSRLVPYLEQKNSRTFQGHISHFSRIPFNAKKSLEYVSLLVLPQHEPFYPEGLSVLAPCRYLRIRVGQS